MFVGGLSPSRGLQPLGSRGEFVDHRDGVNFLRREFELSGVGLRSWWCCGPGGNRLGCPWWCGLGWGCPPRGCEPLCPGGEYIDDIVLCFFTVDYPGGGNRGDDGLGLRSCLGLCSRRVGGPLDQTRLGLGRLGWWCGLGWGCPPRRCEPLCPLGEHIGDIILGFFAVDHSSGLDGGDHHTASGRSLGRHDGEVSVI